MKSKKAEISGSWWIFLIIILILFVVFFPKTCGKIDFISEVTEFSCQGIDAPFINIKNNYSWCYGICWEKSIEEKQINNKIDTSQEEVLGPFAGLKKVLIEKGPILLGIVFLIGILKWMGSLKARKSNLVVYKKI